MKKALSILCTCISLAIGAGAQSSNPPAAPFMLTGNARKQFLDSSLRNAGATAAQVQRFNAAKALANAKMKQAKQDSTLSIEQKEARYRQVNDEKNASYRSILGNDVYKAYNGLKNLSIPAQVVEVNRPSPNKVTRDCLDSANATGSQKQQFIETKKVYKDSVKAVMNNVSLTAAQKKQQKTVLTQHKNSQYVQILGQERYNRFNLAKKRRGENDEN